MQMQMVIGFLAIAAYGVADLRKPDASRAHPSWQVETFKDRNNVPQSDISARMSEFSAKDFTSIEPILW